MQRPLSDYVRAAADAAGVPVEMIVSTIRQPAHYRMAGMALAHREGWSTTQVAAVSAELTGQDALL